MSGGPVFDIQGNVIGIHGGAEGVVYAEDKPIYLGQSYGVPIQTFLQGLDNIFINKEILKIETNKLPVISISNDELLALQYIDKPDDNTNYVSWLNYGNQLWRLAPNHPDTVTAFRKAIELEPNSYEAWYAYGVTLNVVSPFSFDLVPHNVEESLKIFERVLELKPKFAPALYEKGRILAHLNRNEEALESLEEAVAYDPSLFKGYSAMIQIYHELNNKEGVIENAKKLIEIDPNNFISRWLLANIFWSYKNYSEALRNINEAIEIYPYTILYLQRASMYLDLEEYEKAMTDADKVIEINPNSSYGYLSKANVYHIQGKYEEAIKAYNQGLAKDPYSFDAIGGIGLIEYEQGNITQAMEKWQKIIKADRGDTTINNYTIIPARNVYGLARLAMAVALYQQGKQEKAIKIEKWQKIIKANSLSAEDIRAIDIDLSPQQAKQKEAIKLAQKALQIDRSYSRIDHLKNKLWGEKLVADAEELLDNTEIQAFLDNLK
jgi:tetratricopeptide (TPR) repeat protein